MTAHQCASISTTTPRLPSTRPSSRSSTRVLSDEFGNASSIHRFGQRAKGILDDARTCGRGSDRAASRPRSSSRAAAPRLTTLRIRGVAEALEPAGRAPPRRERDRARGGPQHAQGARAPRLDDDAAAGRRDAASSLPARSRTRSTDKTALVSVMHANNEIGTDAADRRAGARSLTNAARCSTPTPCSRSPRFPVDVRALGIDLLSLSAHKFNGPKGAGALWIKRGTRRVGDPDRRASTSAIGAPAPRTSPGIAGLGAAAALAARKLAAEGTRLAALRDRLENEILARVPRTAVNGAPRRARAEHDEHQLRRHRGGVAAHRARPRGHRRLDGIGVLVGNARAVARAARDGAADAPHAELDPVEPRRRQHRTRKWTTCSASCRGSSRSSGR